MDDIPVPLSGIHRELSAPFSDEELCIALHNLNGKAAVGPQGVPSWVIKKVFELQQARAPLLALMNSCLALGCVPRAWAYSEVFVLYKGKGTDKDPSNYRGINLLNDFYRVFERLLQARLKRWSEELDLPGRFQFGFRPARSTADPCFMLRTAAHWFNNHLNCPLFAIFIDLEKAFPSLFRQGLIDFLYETRCPRVLVTAVAACLQGNSCALRVEQFLTEVFEVIVGCREGSITSPDCFNMAYGAAIKACNFQPFPENPDNFDPDAVYILAFADDATIFSGNQTNLITALELFAENIERFKMKVNVQKTNVMCFPGNCSYVPLPLSFRGQILEWVTEFKYLGFHLTQDLSWSTHRDRCFSKAITASTLVGNLLKRLQISNLDKVRTFFQAMIASQLYGRELLSYPEDKFNDLQSRFLRSVFNLPNGYPKAISNMILGVPPLAWQQLRTYQNFANRLIEPCQLLSRQSTNPAKFVLAMDRSLFSKYTVGWNMDVCATLEMYVSDDELVTFLPTSVFDDLGDVVLRLGRDNRVGRVESLSGSSFTLRIFPEAVASPNFRRSMGLISHEMARIVLLFLGDMWRWSVLQQPRRRCDCLASLHVEHFFDCPVPSRQQTCTWERLMAMGRTGEWLDFFDVLRQCLVCWDSSMKMKESIMETIK